MEIRTAKGKLLFALLLIISFPLLQYYFNFFESGQLKGAVTNTSDPTFSWPSWWDGSYQKQKNEHLNDSIGCRPDMVRLNNQVDLWLFKKRHAREVVIGKDQCFFEQAYINEYYGTDYIGEDAMRTAVIQLRKVQDTLERMGKTFVFLYAPSKAYFYADKLPPRPWGVKENAPTNYLSFKHLADSMGIKQIDYNAWFMAKKDSPDNYLFSRLGIHWTVYGSLRAADSFIKYVDKARNIKLPHLHWETTELTNIPQKTDGDLAEGLNLIFPLNIERFSYPHFSYDNTGNRTKPRMVYIGDSFLWVWLFDNLMPSISNEWDVFYYFEQSWDQNTFSGNNSIKGINEIDWHDRLMHSDCISILYVPSSFSSFAENRSSIKKLYDYFYPVKQ
ncbi:MAG: hypothetical protein JWQ38_1455 [Flavipsychrobacter sp.]|nr:hypothetical protein [Flavipsychrobacter sp.]